MKLNEIIQQKIELDIEKFDRPLVFNNLSLADQAWLSDNYTGEELMAVFQEAKIEDILKIAIKFIDDKSKEYISKITIIERDDYGAIKETGKKYTLAEKLFHSCNETDLVNLMRKLFEVRQRSTEMIIKMNESYEKKTQVIAEKAGKQ